MVGHSSLYPFSQSYLLTLRFDWCMSSNWWCSSIVTHQYIDALKSLGACFICSELRVALLYWMNECLSKQEAQRINYINTSRWIITNIQLGTLCIRFCEWIFVDHRNGNEAEGRSRQEIHESTVNLYGPRWHVGLSLWDQYETSQLASSIDINPLPLVAITDEIGDGTFQRVKLSDVHFQHHVLCEIILDVILDRCSPINFLNWLEMLELSQIPFLS